MRPEYWKDCTIDCEAVVECTTCGRRKAPIGRSCPPEAYYCDADCPGYGRDPVPGHLWPGELAEMDKEGGAGDAEEGA